MRKNESHGPCQNLQQAHHCEQSELRWGFSQAATAYFLVLCHLVIFGCHTPRLCVVCVYKPVIAHTAQSRDVWHQILLPTA
jgi:hypothetical protein